MKVLLDQNASRGLCQILAEHEVRTALQMGWDALGNGDLIDAAENDSFDLLITADRNLRYQQNLTRRRLAFIVLEINQWPVIRAGAGKVLQAVNAVKSGSYQAISFDRPAPRGRPFSE